MCTRPFFWFTHNSFHFFIILSILFLSFSITFAEQVVISPDKINSPTFRTSNAVSYGTNANTHINLGFGEGSNASVTGTDGKDYHYCTVGGGYKNIASGFEATVGGGYNNTAIGIDSTIGGGSRNTASGWYSTVGGGDGNIASGSYSRVGGGYWNTAGGDYSWAGGSYMQLTESAHNTFVWGDSLYNPQSITTPNAFLIFPAGTAGKVGIGTPNPVTTLHVADNSTSNTAHIVNSASILFNQTVLKVARTELSGGNILSAVAGTNGDGTGGKVRMVVSTSGNVGIGEAAPSYKLHVNGSVAGTSWTNLSSRDFKKDIRKVSKTAHPMMLVKLMDMELTTYKYKKEYGGDGTTKVGFIAEDMPKEVLSKDGKGVDVYELLTLTIGAMKAQQKTIGEQQKENKVLKAKLMEVMQRLEALEK